ncbi:MAG: hypothetical protein HY996_05270 [Micrococcales bacterium]|nr:hypothetical protein [Micrococcales bacterium]
MTPGPDLLAVALPGRWTIRATNFPAWIRGDRSDPTIEYRLRRSAPLTLGDVVEYRHARQGLRQIQGVDRWRPGGGFVWRGAGMLRMLRSRWEVTGIDGEVAAIRFHRSVVTPAGVDLLVREGAAIPELRTRAAEQLEVLGITVEEFASFTWLAHTGSS